MRPSHDLHRWYVESHAKVIKNGCDHNDTPPSGYMIYHHFSWSSLLFPWQRPITRSRYSRASQTLYNVNSRWRKLPSGNLLQFAIENCHRNSGFTHWKCWIFPSFFVIPWHPLASASASAVAPSFTEAGALAIDGHLGFPHLVAEVDETCAETWLKHWEPLGSTGIHSVAG